MRVPVCVSGGVRRNACSRPTSTKLGSRTKLWASRTSRAATALMSGYSLEEDTASRWPWATLLPHVPGKSGRTCGSGRGGGAPGLWAAADSSLALKMGAQALAVMC